MGGIERNVDLDDLTDEDVEQGRLNDDQIQALWGTTLEKAQNQRYQRIVALLSDGPAALQAREAAKILMDAVERADGKFIEESDGDGILD
jgi:hypothetical protein